MTSRLAAIIRALTAILFTAIAFLAFITISAAVVSVIWLLTGELAGVAVRPSEMAGMWTGTLQEGCSGLRLIMHVTADSAGKHGAFASGCGLVLRNQLVLCVLGTDWRAHLGTMKVISESLFVRHYRAPQVMNRNHGSCPSHARPMLRLLEVGETSTASIGVRSQSWVARGTRNSQFAENGPSPVTTLIRRADAPHSPATGDCRFSAGDG